MLNFLKNPRSTRAPTVAEIAERVAREEMILVDVRELAEVRASGKAKGALHIPLSLMGLRADPSHPDCQLAWDKPVALYCASGGRSGMAAQTLSRLGYAEVHNIGGFGDWVAGGGQVERV